MKKYIKKTCVWGSVVIIVLIIVKLIFQIYILEVYSNHYNTLKIYNTNKQYFNEIVQILIGKTNDLGYFTDEKCEYFKEEKEPYYCNYDFSPSSEFQIRMNEIGIIKITKEVYTKDKDVLVNFLMKKDVGGISQVAYPKISFSKIGDYGSSSRILPYPLSNRFIYIGSIVYDVDSHWRMTWDGTIRGG